MLTTLFSIASGGISTFGNLIIKDFGYTNFEAILFNIPFGAIQIVAILGSSWGATRFKRKGVAIACVAVLPDNDVDSATKAKRRFAVRLLSRVLSCGHHTNHLRMARAKHSRRHKEKMHVRPGVRGNVHRQCYWPVAVLCRRRAVVQAWSDLKPRHVHPGWYNLALDSHISGAVEQATCEA
jgi:hypothetical protein